MGRTSVSRRLVYIKKTKNPVAPLPKRSQSDDKPSSKETARERTAPVLAARASRPVERGSVKFAKLAAIFAGIACAGGAIAVMSSSRSAVSSQNYDEPQARPSVSRPAASRTVVSDPGLREGSLPNVLAQRSAPTDEGFRASAYTRLK